MNFFRDHIEPILVTSVIAGLIWLYAEGENVEEWTARLRLQYVANGGEQLVIEGGEPKAVTLSLRASGRQHRRFERFEQAEGNTLRLDVQPPEEGEEVVVALPERIAEVLRERHDLHVDVERVEPGAGRVRVQRLAERMLPVRADLSNFPDVARVRAERLEPERVKVVAAERDLDRYLARHPDAAVRAILTADAEDLRANRTLEAGVELRLPPGMPGVLKVEGTPRASISVANLTDTLKLDELPLRVAVSGELLRGWEIDVPETYSFEVELVGPSETIARLRDGQATAQAVLRPTADQLGAGSFITPQLEAPEGVAVKNGPLRPLQVTGTRRTP